MEAIEKVGDWFSGVGRKTQAGTQNLDIKIRAMISERPVVIVAGAIGVGFIIGKLIRTSRR